MQDEKLFVAIFDFVVPIIFLLITTKSVEPSWRWYLFDFSGSDSDDNIGRKPKKRVVVGSDDEDAGQTKDSDDEDKPGGM